MRLIVWLADGNKMDIAVRDRAEAMAIMRDELAALDLMEWEIRKGAGFNA